jgi:xylulokinase
MIGTSMCWGYIERTVDARHGLISMPHVLNGAQDIYIFGGAITAGASVTWFREQFCQAEMEAARLTGGDAHRLLEEAAGNVPPGSAGLVFLPYLMGERSPVWDDKASGAFVGLNLFHTRAHLYRSVLEGVSYALRHNIEAGARGTDTLADRLIVVGGAAHSDLWMQIIADITGYPVFTIEENVEAALGAALLAALGAGIVTPEIAAEGWVTLKQHASPKSDAQRTYDRTFEIYKDLYPAMRTSMHRLNDARGM